jgi:Macrocin-O-methyltransferase (TylF)
VEPVSRSSAPFSAVLEADIRRLLAAAAVTPPGAFVEVGVFRGGTAWRLQQLATEQGRELYLYDTFEGIPYQGAKDLHQVGDFSETCYEDVAALLPQAHVVKGIFPDSAIDMPRVAFAHLDCDQYRSVLESAQYLETLMVPGGVIWFDDSPLLEGARLAAEELFCGRLQLSHGGKHYVTF